jgi:zinc transport system substrate-binding protein
MLAAADLLIWVGPDLSPWLEGIVGTQVDDHIALTVHAATHLRTFRQAGAAEEDRAHDNDAHAQDDETRDDGADHDGHAHDEAGRDDHADMEHEDQHDTDHDEPAEEAHAGHAHTGVDPHVWLSTENARAWLGVFADTLAERDPDNAAAYRANAAEATAELYALDAQIESRLAAHLGAEIVTFHESFGYFAEQFGIEVAGSVRSGDASAPSAAAMDKLRNLVADHGIECAFAEPAFDPGLLDAIAGGTGLRIGTLDPTGALLPTGPGHYTATLTGIAEAIADCLERN